MPHFAKLHLYKSISLKPALHTTLLRTALITTILFTIPALHFGLPFWGWICHLENYLGVWDLLAEN
jgi:hypothetical protein